MLGRYTGHRGQLSQSVELRPGSGVTGRAVMLVPGVLAVVVVVAWRSSVVGAARLLQEQMIVRKLQAALDLHLPRPAPRPTLRDGRNLQPGPKTGDAVMYLSLGGHPAKR